MATHNFNFEGGEILTGMGATWFVSYAYYENIDKNHRNWEQVSTAQSRLSRYNKSKQYHKAWLHEVVAMNPANLNKNTIGLNATQTIAMAKELLSRMENASDPQPAERIPAKFEEKLDAAFDSFEKGINTFADNLGKKIDSIDDDDIEQSFIKIGTGIVAFFTVILPKFIKKVLVFFTVALPIFIKKVFAFFSRISQKINKFVESDGWNTYSPFLLVMIIIAVLIAIAIGIRGLSS